MVELLPITDETNTAFGGLEELVNRHSRSGMERSIVNHPIHEMFATEAVTTWVWNFVKFVTHISYYRIERDSSYDSH
jgi:hypothetical protein